MHDGPVEQYIKFPYLLPANHKLTALIVYATHAKQLHEGVLSTVTDVAGSQLLGELLQSSYASVGSVTVWLASHFLSVTLPHYQ